MRKRNTRAMLTYEQKARVEYMLKSGDYSYAEIARQIGCDDQTITRFAVKRGIYRPPAYNPPSVLRKAVALVRAGKSFSQAAASVGATRNAVAGAVWRARTQVSA
jgi:IS30 family transposase